MQRRSQSSSQAFIGNPPAKPVSFPFDPITRWHGTMIGSGFDPLANPTARAALGAWEADAQALLAARAAIITLAGG